MATFQNRKTEASYGRRNRCGHVRTDGEACVHGARVRGFPRHLILFLLQFTTKPQNGELVYGQQLLDAV